MHPLTSPLPAASAPEIRAPRNVAVLGATGSIGSSALSVIEQSGGRLRAFALTANRRVDQLVALATQHRPEVVIAADAEAAEEHGWKGLPPGCRGEAGHDAIARLVADPRVDVVLAAMVGSVGLRSTWAALEAGKTVALANKETLVMAGPLVADLLAKHGGRLAPVDSEHNGVLQALAGAPVDEVTRIVLTASGGPFRAWPLDQFRQITVSDALAHPTWKMGPKITVDSATMMNKALEVIEARWLFNIPADKIEVLIHPQSVVHALVEFVDGSVVAQMGSPDMRTPIQHALDYPRRHPGLAERLNLTRLGRLEFEPPDPERFPALELGFRCAREGGSSGAVLSAANEAAVAAFLEGDLHFTEIVPACASVLESHHFEPRPTLDDLVRLDRWARHEVNTWACA